jgi:hypothetical protein
VHVLKWRRLFFCWLCKHYVELMLSWQGHPWASFGHEHSCVQLSGRAVMPRIRSGIDKCNVGQALSCQALLVEALLLMCCCRSACPLL